MKSKEEVKITITIQKDGLNSTFDVKTNKELPRYEVIGILTVASDHIRKDILKINTNE